MTFFYQFHWAMNERQGRPDERQRGLSFILELVMETAALPCAYF